MESITVLALLGSVVYALVNGARYLVGKQYGRALTLAVVWLAGVLVTIGAGESDLGEMVSLDFVGAPELTLATINGWTQILVGFAIGSAFSGVNDLLAAIDSSRSSAKPELFAAANRPPTS